MTSFTLEIMVMAILLLTSKISSEEAKEMMLSIQLAIFLIKMEPLYLMNRIEVGEVMKGLFGTVGKGTILFGEAGILTEILYIWVEMETIRFILDGYQKEILKLDFQAKEVKITLIQTFYRITVDLDLIIRYGVTGRMAQRKIHTTIYYSMEILILKSSSGAMMM